MSLLLLSIAPFIASGYLVGFAQIRGILANFATGPAGVLFRCWFFPAHMCFSDIGFPTNRTSEYFNGWIAELAGIIPQSTAAFTGLSHSKPLLVEKR